MIHELMVEFAPSLLQAIDLQTRYMELFTMSGDYYKFLGDLLIKMEELKVPVFFFFVYV